VSSFIDPIARLVILAKEVMAWHRDHNSPDYNECDKDPCHWCCSVQEAIDEIVAADLAHGTVTAYKGAADPETAGAVVGAAVKAAVVP
jgi:hypothetical protein